MKYTGERIIPDVIGAENTFQEHLIRYEFASQFCENKVVLDIGCGSGYGSHYLKTSGARDVYGIDISQEAADYCRKKYPSCHYKQGSAINTGYDDHFFDVVVCFELIEHLKEQYELMTEIKRILKKDGVLIMSTPNKDNYPPGNPFHAKELTEKEYTDLLHTFFSVNKVFYEYYPHTLIIKEKESDFVRYLPEKDIHHISDFFISVSTDSNRNLRMYGVIKEHKNKTLPFVELEKLQRGVSGNLLFLFRKVKKYLKDK